MVKIYTKRGDKGETDLNSGERVAKTSLRIEVAGTVDELNSFIGLARAKNRVVLNDELIEICLARVQNELFVLGGDVATTKEKPYHGQTDVPRISAKSVVALERVIDRVDAEIVELRNFILPGGGDLAAGIHVARSVCRRAERLCVALSEAEQVSPLALEYLNRLSDTLFMLARWANHVEKREDEIWKAY